ncbi:hypothetical protein BGZ93_001913 [Podila epicladia]|nr:hypothetical protein BGZ93_001913 [Podila epicladia]
MAVARIRIRAHSIAAASIPRGAIPCIHHPGTRPAIHQWLQEYVQWRSMSTPSIKPPTCRRPRVLQLEAQNKKVNHIPRCTTARHASTSTNTWHIPTAQQLEQGVRTSIASESANKNLPGASSTILSATQEDPSINYWKLYQDKVNKKQRITKQELIHLSRWLGAQPMNKDTALKLTKLIKDFQKAKLPFDMAFYNDLIHFHIKRNKFDDVQWVLDAMFAERQKSNSRVSQRTLALIMAMHLKTGNKAGLDRLIQRQDNGIAHYMAKFLEWTRGLQLTDDHIQTAKRIFFDLQFKRCAPNTPRFTHLLEHLFESDKSQEALGLVNHILDIGYPLNKFTSTCVMSGLVKAKRFEDAAGVWDRVQGNSDVLDISIANGLLAAVSQDPKRLGAAQELWARMNETPGLKPDEYSFACMLSSYIGSKDSDSAMTLWQEMQKAPHWIKPNKVLYNVMMNGLFYTHKPEVAKTLYEELLTRKDLGKMPLSLDTCHIMIRGLLSVRDVTGLQQVLAKMEKDGIEPNGTTYTIMSDVLFSQRDASSADKISDLMASRDLPKTEITYSAMISGYAQNGDMVRAQELLKEMQAAGHQPSIHIYDKAEKWYDEMRKTQSTVAWEPHYVLLRACVEHRQWRTAQRVVKAMKEHPFESHVPRLNLLIQEVERVAAGAAPKDVFRRSNR